MPTGGVLLCGTLVPFFTNLMDDLGEIGTACFIFKMKDDQLDEYIGDFCRVLFRRD